MLVNCSKIVFYFLTCHYGQGWKTYVFKGFFSSFKIFESFLKALRFRLDIKFRPRKNTCTPLMVSVTSFLQRVSIACYAERCISYDRFCLTDRLSVTRWYHAKTTRATIMGSSLEDSPMTLVSSTLDLTPKFQREHRELGRRMREG